MTLARLKLWTCRTRHAVTNKSPNLKTVRYPTYRTGVILTDVTHLVIVRIDRGGSRRLTGHVTCNKLLFRMLVENVLPARGVTKGRSHLFCHDFIEYLAHRPCKTLL